MRITTTTKHALKRLLLGPHDYPQQFPLGLCEPQSEVSVWLHGIRSPRDVTYQHFMLCGAPLTVGIDVDDSDSMASGENARPVLQFRSRPGNSILLGEMLLRFSRTINIGTRRLMLFHVIGHRNYCMPKARLLARYLFYAYQRLKTPVAGVSITAHEIHAMMVLYICPRPIVLVSVVDGAVGNIFPMNLMGPVGNQHYAFALNTNTPVGTLVDKAGAVALSSIPFEQTALAFQLGKNHRKTSINWMELPFSTKPSNYWGLPVPTFSTRVREMSLESSYQLGSHTLFIARIITDERLRDGAECFVVHGIYQAWRSKRSCGTHNLTEKVTIS